jgi:hypothetical protein
MKRILELNVGAMILLTFAVGCGGSSSDSSAGGASSSAGSANANAGAGGTSAMPGGGTSAMPGGGAHSGGQTSMPGTAGAAPGGGFMTSVPGTTPLKDLTPDQKSKLCDDLQKYSDSSLSAPLADYECKALALVAAAQATTDAAAQTACKSSLTGCTPDPTSGTTMCTGDTAATCTATVADLGVCFNDTAAAVNALDASVPSCDGMTLAQAQAALVALAASGDGGFTEPASCTKYDAACGSMTGMP